jgi:hypothetical protein
MQRVKIQGNSMLRNSICLAAVVLVAASLHSASAQTAAPAPAATTAAPATAKPSRLKLTAERLRELKAKWNANKGKLRACRIEVKRHGLVGDDRWFYIEECMEKT